MLPWGVHSALRGGRTYSTDLDPDRFAELLGRHPRITVLPGPPSRTAAHRAPTEIAAFRTGPAAFDLVPRSGERFGMEPPVLSIRFPSEGGTVSLRASLTLGTTQDVLRQWGDVVTRWFVERTGLLTASLGIAAGVFFGTGVLIASLLATLGLAGPGAWALGAGASTLAALAAVAKVGFLRFETDDERAWRLSLPTLNRVAGELITPYARPEVGATARPFRAQPTMPDSVDGA